MRNWEIMSAVAVGWIPSGWFNSIRGSGTDCCHVCKTWLIRVSQLVSTIVGEGSLDSLYLRHAGVDRIQSQTPVLRLEASCCSGSGAPEGALTPVSTGVAMWYVAGCPLASDWRVDGNAADAVGTAVHESWECTEEAPCMLG